GLQENTRENISYLASGHIFISGFEKSASGANIGVIRDDTKLIEALQNMNLKIKYLKKRSNISGSLIFENENSFQQIEGVNFDEETELSERLVLKQGNIAEVKAIPNAIILNEKTADKLKVDKGDEILVKLQTVTGQQNVGEFIVAGITVDSGIFSSFSAYAHKKYVNELLNIEPDAYIQLGIFLEDINLIDQKAATIYAELSQKLPFFPRTPGAESRQDLQKQLAMDNWEGTKYYMSTLSDYLAPFNGIIYALSILSLIVLLILLSIIGVGIMNTFRMVIYERMKEIGTMRALGVQKGSMRTLFILEAFFLSLFGVLVGITLSSIIMIILSSINFGVDSPLSLFMKNGHLTFTVLPVNILVYVFIVSFVAFIASIIPAMKAGELNPAQALHTTI
ncbi:MAG: FtsX-like permease family protein, partial [Spirochaetales bacterium]|nr:FtsX-like permease family protein [Spirochaetales bacterium]